jgi:hypothetical protein
MSETRQRWAEIVKGMTPQTQRTLRDYARHDEDCTTNQCGHCGRWRAKCEGVFAPRSCSCGLDALLSPPPSSPTVEQDPIVGHKTFSDGHHETAEAKRSRRHHCC